MVAFNLREQRVVYERKNTARIDFAALASAIQSPTSFTIDYRLLKDRLSETHFVTKLLIDHLGAKTDSPDAIIIVGPKVVLDRKVPLDSLRAGGAAGCPIFYLNYNPDPANEPWSDSLGAALKVYKQAVSYNIVLPHDFGVAVKDILSRIAKPSTSGMSRTTR